MTQKKTTGTRRKSPKKRRRKSPMVQVSYKKILYFLVLFCLLFFSMSVVCYVIFFRTVVAAELPFEEHDIHFEEPSLPEDGVSPGITDAELEKKGPLVAIIIDDMGYHPDVGRNLISLDLFLSFSFLPHAPFTHELEEMVYLKGNPILLHLPLEPRSPEWDPGPGALYLSDPPETKRKKFLEDLQRVPHATGVNNHMGSRFTADQNAMDELIDLLFEQQLFFIDSVTTSESRGMASARKKKVPTSRRHIFLDNVQEKDAICRQLEKLIKLANHQEYAIGIGHPYPETFLALSSCGVEMLRSISVVGVDTLVQ